MGVHTRVHSCINPCDSIDEDYDVVAATKDSALCCKAWLLLMKVQPDMIPSFDVSRVFTVSHTHSHWCALVGVFYFTIPTCAASRTTLG